MSNPLLSLASWAARHLPTPVIRGFYQYEPLARIIRRALNRAAPGGISEVHISAGQLAGMMMRLDLQTEKDYWLGTYEVELGDAVREIVKPGWVVYDVGANIGYITLLLAKAVGENGRVFAFEALPANLVRLRTHAAINALASRIDVIPGAVVSGPGPVHFLVGPSGGMGKAEGSAGRDSSYQERIPVDGTSLDDFIYSQGNPPPHLVKMDIEGGEGLALVGMKRLLMDDRPVVLMELHGPEAAQAAWQSLNGAGYQISHLEPGFPTIQSVGDLDWKAYILARPLK